MAVVFIVFVLFLDDIAALVVKVGFAVCCCFSPSVTELLCFLRTGIPPPS